MLEVYIHIRLDEDGNGETEEEVKPESETSEMITERMKPEIPDQKGEREIDKLAHEVEELEKGIQRLDKADRENTWTKEDDRLADLLEERLNQTQFLLKRAEEALGEPPFQGYS